MKKLLTAVILVALMGTASFAQTPVKKAPTAKKTEQVAHKKHHKKHHKKATKKAHTKHAKHEKHAKGAKKTGSSKTTGH